MNAELALDWAVMACFATAGAWVGSVAGTGGSTVLLPVLVLFLGVKDAVPVLTICNLTANASRSWINRREIDIALVRWFVLGGVPLTVAGAYLFTRSSPELLTRLLGAFLVLSVAWRHAAARLGRPRMRLHSAAAFGPLGAGFGFLYGFTEGVGPLMAPFFLAYGLLRGAYIGTDALGTFTLQGTKLAVFGQLDVMSARVLAFGLSLAPFMVLGSWLGKHTVDRLSARWFTHLIEAMLLLCGLAFLMR